MKILILCTTDSMIWNFLQRHIRRLEADGHSVECACSRTGTFFNELNQMGFVLHELPFTRKPFSIKNLTAYKKLSTLVKEKSYDVIFCHEPVGGAMGRLMTFSHKLKVVYMAHGFHFFKNAPIINNIIYKPIEWVLSWCTDVLITINDEDFKACTRMHAKKNLLLNGIGVDLSKFRKHPSSYLKEKFNLNDSSMILLSVGELIKRKNHEAIIRTIGQLKNIDIHYFIAGDGPLLETLKNIAQSLNIKDRIHFLGHCRNVNELCNSCDVFILPSYQEGLSLALMEAMACGKPVIASKIRGNIDLIKDGGCLVDVNSIEGYKESITQLYKNKALQERMGLANINYIQKYDIKVIEQKISEIFKTI